MVQLKIGRADTNGIDFIAFRRPTRYDLTGVVNASATILSQHLSQIEVVVAHESSPSTAFKTHPFTRSFPFFEFNSLPEDSYVVFIRPIASAASASSTSTPVITSRTHTITNPSITVALHAHTHIQPYFAAELKAVEHSADPSSGVTIGDPSNPASSLFTLVLAMAVGWAAFKRKQVSIFSFSLYPDSVPNCLLYCGRVWR